MNQVSSDRLFHTHKNKRISVLEAFNFAKAEVRLAAIMSLRAENGSASQWEVCRPCRGLVNVAACFPRLAPWAIVCRRCRG